MNLALNNDRAGELTPDRASSPVSVSILICTRDRAAALHASLLTVVEAVRAWNAPVEVIVIDNGSVDLTASVLAQLATQYPYIHPICRSRPGRSRIFNSTLPQLRGQAVLFTDDDVHVPSSWIRDMATPILTGVCDVVAGKVVLAEHLARPWLTAKMRVNLAEVTDVSGPQPPLVGANMAASLAAARVIGFDESLGPGASASTPVAADDLLFNLRCTAHGFMVRGCDGPPAVHWVDAGRLTRSAMLQLATTNARGMAIVWHHFLHHKLPLLRLRKYRAVLRLAWYRLTHRPLAAGLTEKEFDLAYARAFIITFLAEHHAPPRYPSG